MTNFIPLLFFITYAVILSLYLKKDIELTLPLSMFLVSIIVFFLGLIFSLRIGYQVVIYLPILLLFFLLLKNDKSMIFTSLKKHVLKPSLLLFFLMYMVILFINYRRSFIQWDEFSHVGPMIKEMLRLNDFYSIPSSRLSGHKDYPPIITIFYYIWINLVGKYDEAYLYRALQLFSLSLSLPVFSNFKYKHKFYGLIIMILVMLFLFFSLTVINLEDANFYRTVYLDYPLALVFGFSLFLIITQDLRVKTNVFILSVVLSFLILTKQMGLLFVSFALLIVLIRLAFSHKLSDMISIIVKIFSLPLLSLISWGGYVNSLNLTGQFSIGNINLTSFYEILFLRVGERYQLEALDNFVNALYSRALSFGIIEMNYYMLIIVFIIAFVALLFMSNSIRLNNYRLITLLPFISIIYVFILLMQYLFNFGPYEAPKLASYIRYMNTYWLSLFFMFFLMTFDLILSKQSKPRTSIPIIVLAFILFDWTSHQSLKPSLNQAPSTSYVLSQYRLIQDYTAPNSNIFVVTQSTNRYKLYIIRYLFNDRDFNITYFNLRYTTQSNQPFIYRLSPAEFREQLKSYDYLLLVKVDDDFYNQYFAIFPDNFYVEDNQIYEIQQLDTFKLIKLHP